MLDARPHTLLECNGRSKSFDSKSVLGSISEIEDSELED